MTADKLDEGALRKARDKFVSVTGIEIHLPSDGDLDDEERGRYDGFVAAIETYLAHVPLPADSEIVEVLTALLAREAERAGHQGLSAYERHVLALLCSCEKGQGEYLTASEVIAAHGLALRGLAVSSAHIGGTTIWHATNAGHALLKEIGESHD